MKDLPFIPSELRVLVVDEHDLIRKTIVKVLSNIGVEDITEALNYKQGRRHLESDHFDLVFVELFYMAGDGYTLIDQIRHKDNLSDSPIIVLTGQGDRDEVVKAVDKGADDYILKPFQASDLEKKIVQVLSKFHSPNPVIKKMRVVEKLISEDKLQEASQAVKELEKNVPDHPQANYLKSLILHRDGDDEFAIQSLQKGVAKHPDFLKNYKLLSDIYMQRKDLDHAIDSLTHELEINPKHAMRQIKLANLLIKKGEYLRAIYHLRQALLENNKQPEALYGMGVAYAKDENIEKAIYYFKRYRRVYPDDSKPLLAIIQTCRQFDQDKLAEIALRDEKKQHPERIDTYSILAKFYLSKERGEEAITVMHDAINKYPTKPEPYLTLALIHLERDEDKEVCTVFNQLRKNIGDPESFIKQSELFLNKNKFAQAMATVHIAIAEGFHSPALFKILLTASFRTKQFGKNYFLQKRVMGLSQSNHAKMKTNFEEVKKLIKERRNQRQKVKDPLAS